MKCFSLLWYLLSIYLRLLIGSIFVSFMFLPSPAPCYRKSDATFNILNSRASAILNEIQCNQITCLISFLLFRFIDDV